MINSTTKRLSIGLAAGLIALTACGSDANDTAVAETPAATEAPASTDAPAEVGTIVDAAVANGSFNTLVAAVTAADLAGTLSSAGPFTVFAPSDEALKAVPAKTMAELASNKDRLAAVLKFHVVAGKVTAADVVKLSEAAAVNGATASSAPAANSTTRTSVRYDSREAVLVAISATVSYETNHATATDASAAAPKTAASARRDAPRAMTAATTSGTTR